MTSDIRPLYHSIERKAARLPRSAGLEPKLSLAVDLRQYHKPWVWPNGQALVLVHRGQAHILSLVLSWRGVTDADTVLHWTVQNVDRTSVIY